MSGDATTAPTGLSIKRLDECRLVGTLRTSSSAVYSRTSRRADPLCSRNARSPGGKMAPLVGRAHVGISPATLGQ